MSREMSKDEGERTAKYCVCSDCWGHLIVSFKSVKLEDGSRETRFFVRCNTPGCPCNGYVSKKFVERREGESRAELIEAKTALRQAGILPKRSEKQLMDELGF